jgi:hypothetical protein
MANTIQGFIERLIKEAGLDKMPENFLREFTARLTLEAQKRIGVMAVAELNADKVEELNRIIGDGKKDKAKEINDFLAGSIPDFDQKLKTWLREFAEEVIKKAGK